MKHQIRERETTRAFTLIELVVVVAVIVVLFTLLTPALAGNKLRSRTAGCMDNQRQLALGWRLFADDNNDRIVGMGDGITNNQPANWRIRPGNFPVGTVYPVATNSQDANIKYDELGYRIGLLYRYAQNVKILHCPGDTRIRQLTRYAYTSYSGANGLSGNGTTSPPSYALDETTDILHPAERWLWIEEDDPRPTSVNGFTVWELLGTWTPNGAVDLQQVAQGNYTSCIWWDGPAAFHFNSAVFNYADGHVDVRRWIDDATVFIATYTNSDKAGLGTTINTTSGGPSGQGSPNDLPFVFGGFATSFNP